MTNEEFIKLAREAGFVHSNPHSEIIVRHSSGAWVSIEERLHQFALLVAANEREACAQLAAKTVCDTHLPTGIKIYGTAVAKAISARSNK